MHRTSLTHYSNNENAHPGLAAKPFGAAATRAPLGDATNRTSSSSLRAGLTIGMPASCLPPASTSTTASVAAAPAGTTAQQFVARPLADGATSSPHMDRRTGVDKDPQYVSALTDDVFNYLRSVETAEMPDASYMQRQTDISEKMRSILVDWLVDVHAKFRLSPETFFLAIQLVDRYLSSKLVQRAKLQLVGVTAMLIAAKYEEVYPPEVRDFEYISAKAYSREEILRMERSMLAAVKFRVALPTPYAFFDRFVRAAGLDARQKKLAQFVLEASQQEFGTVVKYQPSVITAAAVMLAKKYMPNGDGSGADASWSSSLMHYTRYAEDTVLPCARELNAAITTLSGAKLEALKKKFAQPKHLEVAPIAFSRAPLVTL
jgi:cyclin B